MTDALLTDQTTLYFTAVSSYFYIFRFYYDNLFNFLKQV